MELRKKLKNHEDITICFVGDSVTHGLNHCRTEETYVAKFAALLAGKFSDYSIYRYDGIVKNEQSPMERFDGPVLVSYREGAGTMDVIKNGIGGNTVQRARNRIDDFTGVLANGKRPDVMFMMFGINDALWSDPQKYVPAETYKSNYKMLIDEVRERNPETFIILMGATFNGPDIEEYCKKSAELAKEENVPYIDLHELWMSHYRAGAENSGQGDWLAGHGDGCHPMPKAAYIMAERIFHDFLKIIDNC